MTGQEAADLVRRERHFLQNVLKDFKSEHADFRPAEGMMSVAQSIKHIAITTNWFKEGAFGAGFDMDFEQYMEEMKKPVTLGDAMGQLNSTYDEYIATLESKTSEELAEPMPENQIFGAAPRMVVITSNADHTAHHRGALTVYLRLLGIVPTMVYSE